jgi:RNA polymerase sigma factor (TIGR02999 family)
MRPTALVHEAWMKVSKSSSEIKDKPHFLAVAARAMRQIMSDNLRDKQRLKRGGPVQHRTTLTGISSQPLDAESMLSIDAALTELASVNEVAAEVATMRLYAEATVPEIAAALGVSTSTVDRSWRMARAHLTRVLRS